VGTGDGLFAYNYARRDLQSFLIGIDANRRPLQKISERIHRRPSKGGLPNILFVQSAVEALPSELDAVANEIYINFPWGSLLRAVASGEESVFTNLARVCSSNARLKIFLGLDVERDRAEIGRLALPSLTDDYVSTTLVRKYRNAGFEIIETERLPSCSLPEMQTSWARRLQGSSTRSFFRIMAQAKD